MLDEKTKNTVKTLNKKANKYLEVAKNIFYKFFNFILIAFVIYSLTASSKNREITYYEDNIKHATNQVRYRYNTDEWIRNYATNVNVDIYKETDYLKKIKQLPQEELNNLGDSLGNKIVQYVIYDFKSGKYLTNNRTMKDIISGYKDRNEEISKDIIENEAINLTPIDKFYYMSYTRNSLAVDNFNNHLNYITSPNDFYEVYWLSRSPDNELTKVGLATETYFTDWEQVNNNQKQIENNKKFITYYYMASILFIIMILVTGPKKLIEKLKNNIISKSLRAIAGLFSIVGLGIKFIIYTILTLITAVNIYMVINTRWVIYDIYYNFQLWNILWFILPALYLIIILPKAVKFINRINSIIIGSSKIVEGDLEISLEEKGEKNLAKLAYNINKIKTGFKVSIDEQIKNERLKSELVTNVSHDLKTPLTSIINYIDILQRKDITEEEKEDYLKILNTKSHRLKLLIDDLFEVSKMNSGKVELEKEEVDIVELLQQALGEFSNLYQHKNIIFKVNSFKDSIIMNLDGKKISRVFENLISNALKYSMENTRVYIDIKESDNGINLSFKNISAYEIDFETAELFERFKRADESRTSSVEGSGLGLAIARSIIDLHGGSMNIEVEGDLFKVFIELKYQ